MTPSRRSPAFPSALPPSPWSILVAGAVAAALLPLACTEPVVLVRGCEGGSVRVCRCADGELGLQRCYGQLRNDPHYDECDCSSSGPTSVNTTVGAGSTTSTSSSSGGGGGGGADPGSSLESGDDVLVDAFVGEAGIYVVLELAVKLVDRSGVLLQQIDYAREITAAAFDGTHLVIADKTMFTTYDTSLSKLVEASVLEECASGVLLSGPRFVCGPGNDWDRIFYTFDALTGDLLASSLPYTYNGVPMRRIPGTDDFITVTVDSSPSDFHLYLVGPTGEAVYSGESPYHGDFPVLDTYAFDGAPATHLFTHEGLALAIYGSGCTPGDPYSSGCFVKDGTLGTLTGAQVFRGMDSAEGKVFGLVDPAGWTWEDSCAGGCLVQRIDAASHTVEAQSIHAFSMSNVAAVRHDPISNALLVAYHRSKGGNPGGPYPGHAVELVPYD